MSQDGIRVEEFNIYSLGAEAVSYHLKDIHTLALQVTEQNIGIVSLELETELLYNNEFPYLNIAVARGTKEEPEEDRTLIVRPTDWLVILWDEIHLFRDPEFRSTFSFDGLSAPVVTDEEIKEIATTAKLRKDVLGPNYHAGSLFKSEGQEPGFYEGIDQEPMEVRTSNWSGKKVLMRVGTYEALNDAAKKMFGPVEEMRTLAEAQGLEFIENMNRETEEKLEASETTRIVPAVGTVDGLPENPHNTQGINTP
jgi:hypothetical protein